MLLQSEQWSEAVEKWEGKDLFLPLTLKYGGAFVPLPPYSCSIPEIQEKNLCQCFSLPIRRYVYLELTSQLGADKVFGLSTMLKTA